MFIIYFFVESRAASVFCFFFLLPYLSEDVNAPAAITKSTHFVIRRGEADLEKSFEASSGVPSTMRNLVKIFFACSVFYFYFVASLF